MKEICVNCKHGDGFKENKTSLGICLLNVGPFVCRTDTCSKFEAAKNPKGLGEGNV